ncbi:hypothetical protein FA10DRAFT_304405 [Acaromyces ingoldii]|uniref:Uncharacterized protein n=1 Tax=Acaromyces ingoldii TaxID=215250 RepID=A0A316YDQ1_9BASI|nr:hypothetical protein FA10DRAFT_304405 [Acaromyces ingoldii]PWN86974.1 hypothetical protein FA10DRAFT_304405 [Acaromyces ingoldii]
MKLPFFSLTLLFFELAGRVTATRSSSARNVPQANIAASNACQGYDDLTTSAFSQDASKTHCEALSALQDAKAAYVGSRMGGTTESQVEQGSNARVDNEGLDHTDRLGQAHSIRFDPFAPLVQDNDLPDTLKFLLNGPDPHEKSGHAPPSAPPPSQLDDSLQGMLLRHL